MKKILYVLGIIILAGSAALFLNNYWDEINKYFQEQPTSAGNVYYVSPSGSDGNAGTLASPWRTINTSVGKLKAGDTLNVRGGTYVEVVSVNVSGTATSPITIMAYPGELPIIDGQNRLPTTDWTALVAIEGNYINMSGFEVKNSGAYYSSGLNISGAHNIASKFNVHHAQENGILIQGDYNTVEDSIAWQNAYNNVNNQRRGWASGLTAARNRRPEALIPGLTSYATIRRNIVFDNWGEGLSCYETDHCTIEDNIIYNNWSSSFYISDASNTLAQRNLSYITPNNLMTPYGGGYRQALTMTNEVKANEINETIINNIFYGGGVCIYCWTNNKTTMSNSLIANNTFVDNDVVDFGIDYTPPQHLNNIVRNNIFTGLVQVPTTGITFSHNNFSVTPPAPAASSTNIIGNPQLARTGPTTPGNLTAAYFKLLASSPLIGAGMVLPQVTDDFLKYTRTGLTPDIGAYEFQTPGVDSTPPSTITGLSATASSSTQVNLAWNASTDNVGVTGYKIYRNESQIGTSTVASFVDAAATGGTAYSYTVTAYDVAGNPSAPSNTATVTTPPAMVAVSISSNNAGNITANSVQINWTTNIPSIGVVSYGTSAANLSTTVNADNLATNQSVPITGLTSGTTYYFKISAGSSSVASSFSTLVDLKSASNIAPLASVTASSQNTGTNQLAVMAIDGVIDGYPGDYTKEWATVGQDAGAWIQLNWGAAYQVSRVVLYDRPNPNDQITSATLTFSDGSTVTVGSLDNAGSGNTFNVGPYITNSLKVTVLTVSGSTQNIGLSELQVYATSPTSGNLAPVANAGLDQTVGAGVLVNLNGNGSSDPNSDKLSYQWIQTAGPSVSLLGASTATPSFTSPQSLTVTTTLIFQLIVNDGLLNSAPDSVNVIVNPGSVTNIAPLASVTASSQNTGTNQQAIKAIDAVIDGYPGDYTHEWATIGQKAGAWIQLKWKKTYTVSQIVLFDRPNTNDQITSATLTFSNGSKVKVGSLSNTGGATVINFPPVVTNTVKVTVNTVSSSTSNIGLAELQVYGF